MASQNVWPQSLKEFANRVFAACTDANRNIVSEELRALIYEKFKEGTIDSTDWANMQLKSLSVSLKKKKRSLGGSGSGSGASGSFNPQNSADEDAKSKRARRFEKEQKDFLKERGEPEVGSSLGSRLGINQRGGMAMGMNKARRAGMNGGGRGFEDHHVDPNVIDWDEHTVVGTSTKLEKPYLRLTSAPDPRTVRSLATLYKTLTFLKDHWRQHENYSYTCDQFKSLRQDLTVQRIKNDLTVSTYEVHARIALQVADLGEFNQCSSQLKHLYGLGLGGSSDEFLGYRILYLLHTKNRRDVNALMSELTPAHKSAESVAHALGVRMALVTGNYHQFFQLYQSAPKMNSWLMDHFVERERVRALSIMAKSYRPSLALNYLSKELAFDDLKEADEFLKKLGADIYMEPTPAEAAGTKSNKRKAGFNLPPLEQRFWNAKDAMPFLLAAEEKFKKVDIKGQI